MLQGLRAVLAGGIITLGGALLIALPASAVSPEGFLGVNPSGKMTISGEPLKSIARSAEKSLSQISPTSSDTFQAECPPTVRCVVMPAAFSANNGDVGDYGNYDKTNRPHDGMEIDSIVIHDTEGDLKSVLDAFKDPTFYASSHYVIDKDGTIYQMVQTKDIAWHAGNWSTNMHSIGIEHVGYAAKSESYTPQMYHASQQLVHYLSKKYGIPKDRAHILGHDNVPARSPARLANMHVDPGPFWNWQQYMAGIGAPVLPRFSLTTNAVTISRPTWPLNKQPVTGCWHEEQPNSCVPDGLQATNFVYLHTQPNNQAPYFTDPALGQGTTKIDSNAARVFHGQTFAVKDKKVDAHGIWYEIWVNGASGWFFSPWATPTAFATNAKTVTSKPGAKVTVYGRAVPELSEYPADLLAVPPASTFVPGPVPLPYTLTGNQKYVVTDDTVPTDNFYAWAIDASFPYDHTLYKGKTKYLQVQAGNRVGYVKASDVIIK